MKRVGIYGGSFNPPHVAHVLAVQHALEFGQLDELAVFPCWRHAFAKDSGLLSFDHRLAMARLAFGNDRRVTVDDGEKRFQVSRTIDLVENLFQEQASSHFVLVVGSDNIAEWGNWHRHDDLDKLVEKFVVPRPGSSDFPWAMPDVSSTAIREWVRVGDWTKIEKCVPPKVVDYIRLHRLWQ